MASIKVLFIGDISGESGRNIIKDELPEIKKEYHVDFTVANAENAAGGKGLTPKVSEELFDAGINVLTLGNHTFARHEITTILDDPRILRPANYPPDVPGSGYNIYQIEGKKIAVINLMGRVFMNPLDCPFRMADKIIEKLRQETNFMLVDFHAEITSEKVALGWYLDGRVSAVIGTHTHVQTADERILPNGTAYLTDAGMTGPKDGVIGMDREIILRKYLTAMPYKFAISQTDPMLNACLIEINADTGKSIKIERIIR